MTIETLFDWCRLAGMTITVAGETGAPTRLVAEGVGERIDFAEGRCVHTDERGSRRIESIEEID